MSEALPGIADPVGRGRIRTVPEDFRVIEQPGFEASGSGEHSLLRVRKRGANTDWVAGQLARFAGVGRQAVSYAGLKDRHAVTEQWFSVHLPGRDDPDWSQLTNDEFIVLEHTRHHRKLKRGALQGNLFTITVRQFDGDPDRLSEQVIEIATQGVPNYFGRQRFGRGGGNLDRAEAWFSGRERVRDRQKRSLYLSAARSAIFNAVLAERVRRGTWNRILDGETVMLDGSHSVFAADPADPALITRLAEQDIHPTGPLWGEGDSGCSGEALALERQIADRFPLFCQGLIDQRLKMERRALRLPVRQLTLDWQDVETPVLTFRLDPGSFATSVLETLFEIDDAATG